MRVYVRHPSEFPVELRSTTQAVQRERLRDVSPGGVCVRSQVAFTRGERVRVSIPLGPAGFEAEGRVAWCRPHEGGFRVGIEFVGELDAFRARMIEQVCHIERYHKQLLAEGRSTSEEEAASEWIAKYAPRFPR